MPLGYQGKRNHKSGQTTPLDPMAGFEKIMKHKSQWDNPDRSRDDRQRKVLRIRLQNIGTYFLDRMPCVVSRWLGFDFLSKRRSIIPSHKTWREATTNSCDHALFRLLIQK